MNKIYYITHGQMQEKEERVKVQRGMNGKMERRIKWIGHE